MHVSHLVAMVSVHIGIENWILSALNLQEEEERNLYYFFILGICDLLVFHIPIITLEAQTAVLKCTFMIYNTRNKRFVHIQQVTKA